MSQNTPLLVPNTDKPRVLVVHASPRGKQAKSRQLAHHFMDVWAAKFGMNTITEHDTVTLNLPHLVGENMNDVLDTASESVMNLTPDQQQQWHQTHQLVSEYKQSDLVAVFSPLWNFGMPSHLKAWVEHLSRYGRMYYFTEAEGLHSFPPPYGGLVVSTIGGDYGINSIESHWNHLYNHMETVFEFWGMKPANITRIDAEKLDIVNDTTTQAEMRRAKEAISNYIASYIANHV